MRMPDGNSVAELDNDLQQTKADRAFAAFEYQAREDVRERWLRKPSMDGVIEALGNMSALDTDEFLGACGRQCSRAIGDLLTTALERYADVYLDTDYGQQQIEDRVSVIQQEEHDQ